MSCCNQCFEVALEQVDGRQVQGHHLCSPPNQEQIAAFVYGERPSLEDNRWWAREAIRSHIDDDGCQV